MWGPTACKDIKFGGIYPPMCGTYAHAYIPPFSFPTQRVLQGRTRALLRPCILLPGGGLGHCILQAGDTPGLKTQNGQNHAQDTSANIVRTRSHLTANKVRNHLGDKADHLSRVDYQILRLELN